MSVDSYKQVRDVILANEEITDFISGRSIQFIIEIESRLGFRFKGLYLYFLGVKIIFVPE